MSFLQLVLSLDKTIRDLILFCRQCHSDPYRNTVVAEFVGSTQGVKLVVLQKKLGYSDASKLLFLHQNAPVSNMSVLCAYSGHKNGC